MRTVKILLAATLQLGLIASIGYHVGWPYMNYVLYAAIASGLLTLVSLIVVMARSH